MLDDKRKGGWKSWQAAAFSTWMGFCLTRNGFFKITGEPSRRSGGLFLRTVSLAEITGTSGEMMNRILEKYYHTEDGGEIQKDCKERVLRHLA